MKFVSGDETDQRLCNALKHEFLRCREAYEDFIVVSQQMRQGHEGRAISYRAYNAYARFLLHLYEFLMACEQRARNNTAQIPRDQVDTVIAVFAQRAFARVTAPFNSGPLGAAPYNDGITVPIETLKKFAEAFRKARNTAMGHVKHERAELNLSTFYRDYHKYLLSLFSGSLHMWGYMGEEFPDLGEVTAFSVLVKND
ncbi:hypothetical protein WJ69_07110 [Burkholderia ubonensis]|uniref:hypothetical protein n=1 Tax=Burkholderia ubonensis TaxID=101571 RepID=UPI000752FC4C|nr:hypothetical protein [Burkholderia ubonensis]KVN94966.1 hypothetical protein WJ69_07110 [Burkholderia ubonensis]KVU15652.1 hypothetical protein WK62_27630 [Burkholderia ubonensis]